MRQRPEMATAKLLLLQNGCHELPLCHDSRYFVTSAFSLADTLRQRGGQPVHIHSGVGSGATVTASMRSRTSCELENVVAHISVPISAAPDSGPRVGLVSDSDEPFTVPSLSVSPCWTGPETA